MIKQNTFGWAKPILSWFAIPSLDFCNFVMILIHVFLNMWEKIGEKRVHNEKLVYYTGSYMWFRVNELRK